MKKKGWKRQWFVLLGLVIVLLPFAQSFINGMTAIALTEGKEKNEQQLFDNEYGKASIQHQIKENHVDWQINIHKNDNKGPTRLTYSLQDVKDKAVILPTTVKDDQSSENLFEVKTDKSIADYGQVVEKEVSTAIKNDQIKFTTPVVSEVNLKVSLNTKTNDKAEEVGFSKEYPITLVKANVTESTTIQSSLGSSTVESTAASSSEATKESTSGDVTNLGDADEATVDSAKKEAEKKYEETGRPQTITRSAAVAESGSVTPGGEIPKANELVISNDIDNSLDQISVEVTGIGVDDYTLNSKKGTKANYANINDYTEKVFTDYGTVNGAKSIIFKNNEAAEKAKITINYPNVGTYNKKSIGARLTITNIISADTHSWTGVSQPVIDVATSLYSGMVYDDIKGMDISFQFTATEDSSPIEMNKNNTFITFASLNSNDGQGPEFVFPHYDTHFYLTSDTSVKQGIVPNGSRSSYPYGQQEAFYGYKGFDDNLAAPGYVNGAVSFNAANGGTYTIGSLASRSWTSFMSSVLVPIDPGAPTKTVTQSTDWDSRDKNELNKQFLNSYLTGSDKKHSYFINQPLYSSDESIGRPDAIQLIDNLPEYVIPESLYLLQKDKTINLSSLLPKKEPNKTKYEINASVTGEDLKQIDFDGSGLSFRVDVKVNPAFEAADKLKKQIDMVNTATVNFNLNGVPLFSHDTNDVTTYVRPKDIDIPVEKRWTEDKNYTKLRKKVTLQLQKTIDNGSTWENVEGKKFEIQPTDTGEALKTTFTSLASLEQNHPVDYRVIEVFENGQTSVPGYKEPIYSKENGTFLVTNELLKIDLNFTKIADNGEPLSDVTFKLMKNDGSDKKTVTTGPDGKVSFEGLTLGKYQLEETQTADGYELGKNGITQWDFEVTSQENQLSISWEKESPIDKNGNFVNKLKVPLPATGGMGVWLIYGTGALAIIVAGGYYFLRNKSKGEA
ncbi:Cna B-type domain-containing protein [Enterococcus sp. MJM12]|uniref:Cna B-type domain-containing protein n=2 Tax=Candidatus Enterococcus myersii TaxID=2815322 RepID=A0ABS3H4A2_9ENTE|nr:Cna B-type domain-containing protein [Enterococcus sp. MJM12]